MRNRNVKMLAAVVAAVACVAVPAAASASPASTERVSGTGWSDRGSGTWSSDDLRAIGLTGGGKALARFQTDRPERADRIGTFTGLAGDAFLVGIDYRVQNGKLYGVGNLGGIYTVSDRDAKASKVGQLSVPLSGTLFGVDFNPAANALRVVSDNGQNLRQPFGTTDGPTVPTVLDGALNYTAGTAATGVTGVAYTNNDLSADSATTLFAVDTVLDQVAIQSPANTGSEVPTGKLGVNADPDAGFDIYSTVRNDRAVDLKAFATIGIGGTYRLYSIDLLGGFASSQGTFKFPVTDIAIPLNQL
jgi:Domain of unknown function (DUF4394)